MRTRFVASALHLRCGRLGVRFFLIGVLIGALGEGNGSCQQPSAALHPAREMPALAAGGLSDKIGFGLILYTKLSGTTVIIRFT